MTDIFKDLSKYGFSNVPVGDIYNSNNDDKKTTTEKEKNNPQNQLFLKEVHCPVCNVKFKALSVKVNAPRIVSKDSDFFSYYAGINPYFYEILICPHCGYSAFKNDFSKIREFQINLVRQRIMPNWKFKEFPDLFTAEVAIERYKLALLTAMYSNAKNSTKAILCLKIAWMYRLLEQPEQEQVFLNNALQGFTEAYTNESFPIYGLDKFSTMYLIGELYRRVNKYGEALIWYSRVITTLGAPQKIKDLCRDGRDIIKGLQC